MHNREHTVDFVVYAANGRTELSAAVAQTLEVDLLSAEVRCNPYPVYKLLRAENSLFWSPHNQAWVITRYQDAVQLLSHPRIYHWAVSKPGQDADHHFPRLLGKWIAMMDPRTHSCLRKVCAPIFTQKSMGSMREYLLPVAENILDNAQREGTLDVVNDFADPLSLVALARLFGIPDKQTEQFQYLAQGLIGQLLVAVESTQTREASGKTAELIEFLAQLLAAKQGSFRVNTLIPALQDAKREEATLTDDDVVAFLLLFLFAGHENIMNFIGNAIYALITNPQQLAHLQTNPQLLPVAVEELLRFDSPIQFMTVVAGEDVRIMGVLIPGGDQILVCIGSANHDEEQFSHSDQLDLTRHDNRHLSFGRGALTCIGSILARLEGGIAIGSLIQRLHYPSLKEPLQLRHDPPVLRGFTALKLNFRQ